MPEYTFREANENDVDFIVQSIIEAEKSGTDILSYSRIFNLTETELRMIFSQMLLEGIEGCEFSISSYIVAVNDGKVVGTIGAWVEEKDNPSSIIKANLLGYYLPRNSLTYASQFAEAISTLNIEHVRGALSFVIVYVSEENRGKRLFEQLANEHIKRNPHSGELSIQLMANNIPAIKAYERYGFKKYFEIRSENEMIPRLLPYNMKILMKKILK